MTMPKAEVENRGWRSTLDTIATIAIILTAGVVLWPTVSGRTRNAASGLAARPQSAARRPEPLPPSEPVSIDGAAVQGSNEATVALIEYSDFQCPFCGAFARDTLPEIERQYVQSGKVLVAFRNLPLSSIHPFAKKAAEAAECARRQGKFWQLHDRLFLNQQNLDLTSLKESAQLTGLDAIVFNTCLAGQAEQDIDRDEVTAQKLGITGTPTFFVGRV